MPNKNLDLGVKSTSVVEIEDPKTLLKHAQASMMPKKSQSVIVQPEKVDDKAKMM